ncbi:MAG: hypothetical protein ACWGQW_01640 [bacterium]
MKYLVTLCFLMVGCVGHVQHERATTFFAAPRTYHQVVMEYGLPSRVVQTPDTIICEWNSSNTGVVAVPFNGMTVATSFRSGWRLLVVFSKHSKRIVDWRFSTY